MQIDPTHPRTLYAATRDGVFVTDDGGRHWNVLNAGIGRDFDDRPRSFTVDGASRTVYAGSYAGAWVIERVDVCHGDCNRDAVVTIEEVMRGVNISLDALALEVCSALDSNHSGRVEVDELVASVDDLLSGCGAPPAPSFETPIESPVRTAPETLVATDTNRDGLTDLVITNADQIGVLLGHGDGTFSAERHRSFRNRIRHSAVSDLNGDAIDDVLLQTEAGFVVLLGRGTGTFFPSHHADFGASHGFSFGLGDLNGDHAPDLASVENGVLLVSLNRGDGSFADPRAFERLGCPEVTGGECQSVFAVADVDGDGANDVVTDHAVFPGTGDGDLLAPRLGGAWGAGLADFDRDGLLDAFSAWLFRNQTVAIRRAHAGGASSHFTDEFASGGEPWAVAASDLDGDGAPDLVTGTRNPNGVGLLRNLGDGGFLLPDLLPLTDAPSAVLIADVNTDAVADIVVASHCYHNFDHPCPADTPSTVTVWLGRR